MRNRSSEWFHDDMGMTSGEVAGMFCVSHLICGLGLSLILFYFQQFVDSSSNIFYSWKSCMTQDKDCPLPDDNWQQEPLIVYSIEE